jgi:hypothetical protein
MIARLNVTTVMTTVRIAEYKPTRFEVVVDDSVPATDLSSLVISITPSITSSYKTAHIQRLQTRPYEPHPMISASLTSRL